MTANPCIVGPLGFKEIWTSSAATYYPLVLSSFWVQHALWGLKPFPYHLVNIAMHAACVVMLWLVLRCLKVRGAWLGAALWGLHPVQVESVAWITELKNTQSCLFYLLAIWFFLKWRAAGTFAGRKGTERDYAFALLCAAPAILSKASTVMLPVMLGLVWWWCDGRWSWRNVFRLAPFVIISAAASGWTIWEQQFHSGALGPKWSQSRAERLVIAGKVVWFYLSKLLWPHPLIFIYLRWEINASRPAAWLPVLALAGATIVTAADFFKKRTRFLTPALCGLLLLVLSASTWQQCGTFNSMESLWRTTLAKNPDCWMAHNNLGLLLKNQGRIDEAIEHYHQTLQLDPNAWDAQNDLGAALAARGQFDEAIGYYQQAIQANPNRPETFFHLGTTLDQLGRTREAIAQYREALRLNPNLTGPLNNLAWLLAAGPDAGLRNGPEAVRLAPRACELTHDGEPLFIATLAAAYAESGRFPEAVAAAETAEQVAIRSGSKELAGKIRQLLAIYRAGKHYHEPAQNGR